MLPLLLLLTLAMTPTSDLDKPFYRSEFLFPPHPQHNHGSCVVETPKGDLLAVWYRGSGERTADDVAVFGAKLHKGDTRWTEPFLMADTPGFPDTNPAMIIDTEKRLWLFWNAILDNHWESALLKCKTSRDFDQDGKPPRWESESVILLKPGEEFLRVVQRDLDSQWQPYLDRANDEEKRKIRDYLAEKHRMAERKLSVRLGWMGRPHPTLLDKNRLLLPLYSDGFDFSLIAITDDGGKTWRTSEPIVGPGNVQPSIVVRQDGTLVAYFRDNGPPPQRVMTSESQDRGLTWSRVRDTERVDTGAGVEALVLKSGRWLLVHNDVESGRYRLAISISEDEGRTWTHGRYLENDAPGPESGGYSYPSILQAKDGTIHVTYSYRGSRVRQEREGKGETIKHAQFNEAWLLQKEAEGN